MSRGAQALLAMAAVSFGGILLYGAGLIAFQDREIAANARRLAELTAAYDDLAHRHRLDQERFLATNAEIEERYRRLGALTQQNGILQESFAAAAEKLGMVATERDTTKRSNEHLSQEVRALQAKLAGAEGVQRELVQRLQQQTTRTAAILEKALRMTQLDIEKMIRRAAQEPRSVETAIDSIVQRADGPRGGPFIAYAAQRRDGTGKGDPGSAAVTSLEKQLIRLDHLQSVLERLPLGRPMDGGYVSSSFGRRNDPITRQPAFHAGMDFAGAPQAPVMATAAGVVTIAGRHGPYGRMVEIDHGLGIKTRYAHLRQVHVKAGQHVGARQILGVVGSSGRSTGVHLHYEIVHDDESLDPANFIEAGNYVLKQQKDVKQQRRTGG